MSLLVDVQDVINSGDCMREQLLISVIATFISMSFLLSNLFMLNLIKCHLLILCQYFCSFDFGITKSSLKTYLV